MNSLVDNSINRSFNDINKLVIRLFIIRFAQPYSAASTRYSYSVLETIHAGIKHIPTFRVLEEPLFQILSPYVRNVVIE